MEIEVEKDGECEAQARLLDVLYELLAQGGDVAGRVSTSEIEGLLHEHARSPKSETELRAFFERHGLSTDAKDYASEPELRELASGLYRERTLSAVLPLEGFAEPAPPRAAPFAASLPPAVPLSPPPAAAPELGSRADLRAATELPVAAPAPALSRAAFWPNWAKLGLAASALLAVTGLAFGYVRAQGLEAELERARLKQQTAAQALSALESRAAHLATALEVSNAQRAALGDSFQAYVQSQEAQRGREQAALEQVLGRRYRALREASIALPQPSQ